MSLDKSGPILSNRWKPAHMFNPFKKKPFGLDDFAKLVLTEAKKTGIAESLEYDPERFVLKRGDQRTYLANLFNNYRQADDAHKKRILGNTLALLRQKKENISLEEAESKVVAAVREQALFSFTSLLWELEGGKNEPKIAFEPISKWFARCLVLDFPELCLDGFTGKSEDLGRLIR